MNPTTTKPMPDLHLVASLMDEWTREDNEAMAVEIRDQEHRIEHLQQREFDMAGEITRLNRLIAQMEDDNRHLIHIVDDHRIASETMQRVIVMSNEQFNVTIPDRLYEHVIATDHLGVAHVVIRERYQAAADAGVREVIDLTTEEEMETDGEETEDEEYAQDMDRLLDMMV